MFRLPQYLHSCVWLLWCIAPSMSRSIRRTARASCSSTGAIGSGCTGETIVERPSDMNAPHRDDQAAEWLIAIEDEDSTLEVWDAFEAWLDDHPKNLLAYERARKVWSLALAMVPDVGVAPDNPACVRTGACNITVCNAHSSSYTKCSYWRNRRTRGGN